MSDVVLVSEYELRHVRLLSPTTETWYDAERNQLMRESDVYHRSLSILGGCLALRWMIHIFWLRYLGSNGIRFQIAIGISRVLG